jgi:sec-independent protein translocase protein TatC
MEEQAKYIRNNINKLRSHLIVGGFLAIMVIFVAAAVITPSGDPVSLLALGVPMTVLYVVAILIGWLVVRRRGSEQGA